jgi:hypothetical protein
MKTFLTFKRNFAFLFFCSMSITFAQDLNLDLGADIVSLYIWRGLNVNDAVNIQPSFTLNVSGFSAGFWGSYGLLDNETENPYKQEIDTWINYTYEFSNGMSIGGIVTDYYFPSAGIPWGNFNNYDNPDGGGAHTIEGGLSIEGPESFPVTLSGFINVYNDAGNNTYFQIDYSSTVAEIPLDFFIGAAGGSTENSGYYGTEKFNVINLGVGASKSIKVTEDYSIPISVTFIINPRAEVSYLVFGLTF